MEFLEVEACLYLVSLKLCLVQSKAVIQGRGITLGLKILVSEGLMEK